MGVQGYVRQTIGGNNVNTTGPIDCSTNMSPVTGDLQFVCVGCGSLNANTDWTTRPDTTGWTELSDLAKTTGGTTARAGIWYRVYGGAGGTGNPTCSGPTDATTSGYYATCLTLKTTSNRTNSAISVDAFGVVDARAGSVSLPSLTASKVQATYFWLNPLGGSYSASSYPLPGFIGTNNGPNTVAQVWMWPVQGEAGGVITPNSGILQSSGSSGYVFAVTDGGANTGYAPYNALVDNVVAINKAHFPMPPKMLEMQTSEFIETVFPFDLGNGGIVIY